MKSKAFIKVSNLPPYNFKPTKAVPDNPNVIGVRACHIKVRAVPKKIEPPPEKKRVSTKRINRQQVAMDLYKQGKTPREIADITGWSYSVICKYTRDDEHPRKRTPGSLDDEFIKMYEAGVPYKEIGRQLGVTKEYVSNKLSKLRRQGRVGRRKCRN